MIRLVTTWIKLVLFGCNVFVAAFRGRGEIINIFDLIFPSLTFIYGNCCRSIAPWMGSRMVSFTPDILFVKRITLIPSQGHNSSEIPLHRSASLPNSEHSNLTNLLRYRNGVWSYAVGGTYTRTS